MHETYELVIALVLGAILGIVIGLGIGSNDMRNVRLEAVRAGAAKFIVSDEGNAYFEWIKK
jgi:ABC-type nitrate/sulfonate/bicarbonate transport system permease component